MNIAKKRARGSQHARSRGFVGSGGRGVAPNARAGKTSADQRLGNMAVKEQQDFSRLLWRLQSYLWEISKNPRFRGCHRWRRGGSNAHLVWNGQGSAWWGGLQTSSSPWCSPLSAASIAQVRQAEVETAVKTWVEQPGRSVAFMTLTLRHNAEHALADLWDALSYCWRGITGTASWRGGVRMVGDQQKYGIKHFVKSVEITHGKNGFHPHLHVLLFLDRKLSVEDLDTLRARLFSRWEKAALRSGLESPTPERGLVIEQAADKADGLKKLASYLAKGNISGLGKEITGSLLKSGRGENRTLFEVLRDWGETRSARDYAIWAEYERASEGRRQISWSKGAKEALGVNEKSDDAAESDALDIDEARACIVALLDGDNWRRICDDVVIRDQVVDVVARCSTPEMALRKARKKLESLGLELVNLDAPRPYGALFAERAARRAAGWRAYVEKFSVDLRDTCMKNAPTMVDRGAQGTLFRV